MTVRAAVTLVASLAWGRCGGSCTGPLGSSQLQWEVYELVFGPSCCCIGILLYSPCKLFIKKGLSLLKSKQNKTISATRNGLSCPCGAWRTLPVAQLYLRSGHRCVSESSWLSSETITSGNSKPQAVGEGSAVQHASPGWFPICLYVFENIDLTKVEVEGML